VSSSVLDYSPADIGRLLSYLNNLDSYHKWVNAVPQLDLPESHPKIYELESDPTVAKVENDAANDIIRLLEVTRFALANSQSARRPSGLINFDSVRLQKNTDKIRSLVVDHIGKVQPLDNPESAPRNVNSGTGLVGI